MKNLKRIFSLLLVLTMLFTSALTSYAASTSFTDVDTNDRYAEAITLLSGLGIIQGYENGKFKPEGYITRAEAATIIVRTLGMDDNVRQGSTIFSDVPSTHWASGYINIAVENGIINGFPEGTFLPEEYVTYEQIVKMVVCAIGHEPKAKEYGTYPQGYIRAASEARVTKGISGLGSDPAPRGLVAQLIYNALEVEMMDATTYSTGLFGVSYSYNGKTLLRDYLEIEKVDAIVTDTYLTGETFSSKDKYVELEITDVYTLKSSTSRPLYDEDEVLKFDQGNFDDATGYLGKAIVAYVGEDKKTGKDTIFAIAVDETRNTEVEVTKDRFFESESGETVISYTKKASDKRTTKLDLDKRYVLVVNGEIVDDSVTKYFDTFDSMTLIDNDRDGEYDFVFIDEFDSSEGVEFVVTDIDRDDDYYYFEGDDGELELDYSDDEVMIKIIKDGKEIDPDDIGYGDTLTCLNKERSIITVYVSDAIVKGEIEEVDTLEGDYYINNKAYELSPAFSSDLYAGDKGTFYLNYKGKIAYTTVASRVAGGDYIFITAYDTQTKFSKTTYLIQAVTEEGKVETFTLKSTKMKYVDHAGNIFKSVSAKSVYDYLVFNKTEISDAYRVGGYAGIARVKVSSAGVISEIYMPGRYEEFYEQTKYATENSKEYNTKRGTYGVYDFTGKEIAFRIDDSESDLTDAVEAGKVSEFFRDGDSYVFVAYGERSKDIEAVVITNGISAAKYSDNAVVVTKVSEITSDGERTTRITGIKGGVNVSYVVDPDENYRVEVGNIILVTENAKGYIDKLEFVAKTTSDPDDLYDAFDGISAPSDKDAGIFAGMIEDKSTKRFKLEDIEEQFYNDTVVKYTLVDYTGRTTTYQKASFSDIKLTSRYDYYAVVRTYEDEVVDVVIFKIDSTENIDVPSIDIWDTVKPVEPEEPTTKPEEPTAETTEAATKPEEPTAETTTEAPTKPEEPTAETTEAPTKPEEPTAETMTEATTKPEEPTAETTTEAPTKPEEPTAETTTEAATKPEEPTAETTTEAPTKPEEPTAETTTEAPTKPEEPTAETTMEAPTKPEEPTAETTTEAATKPEEPTAETTTEAPTKPEEPTAETTEANTKSEESTTPTDGPVLAGLTEKKVTVDSKLADEILKLINAERAKMGLPALVLDKNITAVTDAHCIDMATNKYLAQKNRQGADLAKRLTDAKIQFTASAENLAMGKFTPQVIVDAWMKSEIHKTNILNKDFTKVGISVATALDGTVYWAVDFVK